MGSHTSPLAKEVGDAFAEQYYRLLQDYPTQLHRVYNDSSKIGRPGNDVNMCFYTLSDIGEKLNMLSSGGFDSVEVSSVNSQDSMDGSVFVNVSGYFTSNERLKRNFIQVFFLAPQETGYFALNDMFKFEDGLKISDASVVKKAIPKDQGQDSVNDTVKKNNQESQECSAVHVKNLPANYSIDSIENVFKKFGPVRRGGIRLINPNGTYYYGTVIFEEAKAAQRAIKASPVMIGGNKVKVEKKRVDLYTRPSPSYREEIRTMVVDKDLVKNLVNNLVKSARERRKLKEEEERKRWNFWDWQRFMEEETKFMEEVGETGVDHSWDYDVVMEEYRKFMEEEQRKIQEEEEENQH